MASLVPSLREISLVCRLCLLRDNNQVKIPIFDEDHADINPKLSLIISALLPIEISKEDKLPKKICDGCCNKLNLLYKFRSISLDSEKTLLTWLAQADIEETTKPVDVNVIVKKEIYTEEELPDLDLAQNPPIEEFQEVEEAEIEEPLAKRPRRSAASRAHVSIVSESDNDEDEPDTVDAEDIAKLQDESDNKEASVKLEDESEGSDNEPGTSAYDQPGPSGLCKSGAEAPKMRSGSKKISASVQINENQPNQIIPPIFHENISEIISNLLTEPNEIVLNAVDLTSIPSCSHFLLEKKDAAIYREDDDEDSISSTPTLTPVIHANVSDSPIRGTIKIEAGDSVDIPVRGNKRIRREETWMRVKVKKLKNSGKEYTTKSGRLVPARTMKPPCTDKCILGCNRKISEEFRRNIFEYYWNLASLQRQRDFLGTCIERLELKYRRISAANPRNQNCAFYLQNNGQRVRVCKLFLMSTLGLSERTLRTIIKSKVSGSGIIPQDRRGKHGHHKKITEEILNSVRLHIESQFIDGLSIAKLHRDYKKIREELGEEAATYDTYAKIFNSEVRVDHP